MTLGDGVIVLLLAGLVGWVGWIMRRLWSIERDLVRVMEVLAAASPSLERRIRERGSEVVFGERWFDEAAVPEEFDDES